ncbi:unnamed protein product [Kuraishia capsulata CBS 1993]|uniref:Uncharacterized protein n=1 Tax=Kuraishia capsulata CBS 1993 TaxID=1382522 RepID=W6MVU7_9ASCO|nr:uncharacterized protein KUCA_T00002527001 [Kuraishia capsulata CBS 1993]CDK26555.1 unnamed protein product [Kuraishia capsulata CBS 1993]
MTIEPENRNSPARTSFSARRSVDAAVTSQPRTAPAATTSHRHRSSSESRSPGNSRFSWVRRLMNNTKTSSSPVNPQLRANLQESGSRAVVPRMQQRPVRTRSVSAGGTPSSGPSNIDAISNGGTSRTSSLAASSIENASTAPMISVSSMSVTSGEGDTDSNSVGLSTTATSIAPTTAGTSVTNNPGIITFNNYYGYTPTPSIAPSNPATQGTNMDNSSIVTLASSTRNRRRRSMDTNASTLGIPPASIYERMTSTTTPLHAPSIHASVANRATATIDDSLDQGTGDNNSSIPNSDGMSNNDITSIRSLKSYTTTWTAKTGE